MKLDPVDRDKIINALIDLKGYSKGSNSCSMIWEALERFVQDRGVNVIVVKGLASRRKAWGAILPNLNMISIQSREARKMLFTLSHEVAHLIFFKAGIFQKYDFEEDLADVIGETAISLLVTA